MACELFGKQDGTDLLGSGRSVHAEPHPARLHPADEMIVESHVVVLGQRRGIETIEALVSLAALRVEGSVAVVVDAKLEEQNYVGIEVGTS